MAKEKVMEKVSQHNPQSQVKSDLPPEKNYPFDEEDFEQAPQHEEYDPNYEYGYSF